MNDVNYILNDESKNDKILIKELSVYIKNHKDNKLPINGEFVNNIIDIVLRNSEIDFETIVINDQLDNCSWTTNYMRFNYSIYRLFEMAESIKHFLCLHYGDMRFFRYIATIAIIVHESTHARQDYVRKNEKNKIYMSCEEFILNNYKTYKDNHDLVLIERYASLRGYTIAYEVLSYIYPLKYVQNIRSLIFYYLMYGYRVNNYEYIIPAGRDSKLYNDCEIISAIDSYNMLMEQIEYPPLEIDIYDDMNLYDRFYLGSDISVGEYHKLRNLYSSVIYNRQNEGKLKELINKL